MKRKRCSTHPLRYHFRVSSCRTCFDRATFASWEVWLMRQKIPLVLCQEVWSFVGFQPRKYKLDHFGKANQDHGKPSHCHDKLRDNAWHVVYNCIRQWEYDHNRIVPHPLFARIHELLCTRVFLFRDMLRLQRAWDQQHDYIVVTLFNKLETVLGWQRSLSLHQDWTGLELDFFIQRPMTDVKAVTLPLALHYVKTPQKADWFLSVAERDLIEQFG